MILPTGKWTLKTKFAQAHCYFNWTGRGKRPGRSPLISATLKLPTEQANSFSFMISVCLHRLLPISLLRFQLRAYFLGPGAEQEVFILWQRAARGEALASSFGTFSPLPPLSAPPCLLLLHLPWRNRPSAESVIGSHVVQPLSCFSTRRWEQ